MDTYQITLERAGALYEQAQRESLLFEITFLTEVGINGPESTVRAADTLADLDRFIGWLAVQKFPVRVRMQIGGLHGDWSDMSPDDFRFLRESYNRIYGNRLAPDRYEPYAHGVGTQITP